MLLGKLKTTMAIAMASALLSGTALLGHRAMGLPQAPTKQQQPARVDPEGKPTAAAPPGPESPELEALGKARIGVAAKMLDLARRRWQAGEIGVLEYLTVVKRHDEVVADVMVKTDADRIRHLEHQIGTLKRIEETTREFSRRGEVAPHDVLTAELARLDAEYALAKVRAKARSSPK